MVVIIVLEYRFDPINNNIGFNYIVDAKTNKFPFYLYNYGMWECGKKYYTKRDRECYYIFIYTVSGEGYLRIKGNNYKLSAGKAVVFSCMDYHEYGTLSENEPWKFYYMHIGGYGINAYLEYYINNPDLVTIKNSSIIESCFVVFQKYCDYEGVLINGERSHAISGVMLEMLNSYLYEISSEDIIVREDINKAVEYIHNHLSENLKLEQLMQIANLSKYHFIRLFKIQTGTSPYQYIQICRINRAKKLLHDKNKSISDIAMECGFTDPAGFARTFKEFTGVSPTKYRK